MLGNGIGYSTKFKHNLNNMSYIIDYGDESLSNRLAFAIIPFILKAFEEEKILIIDDIDSFLDNRIIEEIINMFKNSKGQIVFITHSDSEYDCKTVKLI